MTSFLRFALWLSVTTSFIVSYTSVRAQLCELRPQKPCGDRMYFLKYSFCCDERIHPYNQNISNGLNDCCNGSPYNSFTHVCCGGCLHTRNDTRLKCCGKEVYSTRSQTCCGGVVSKRDHFVQCCGGKLYNQATHACCQAVTYPVRPGRLCCGSFTYDVATQICCSGCTHPKVGQHTGCCYRVLFDTRTQICCGGVLFDEPGSRSCCEKVAFNRTTHICCGRRVVPKKFGINTRCCYHYRKDAAIYDIRSSRCCNSGVVTSRTGHIASRTRCCSNLLYLPDSYTACCTHVTYNPMTHACCPGKIASSVNIKQRSHRCCNGLYYDSTKAKCCCGIVIYTNDLRGTGCCDGKLFKLPGVCCQNKWFPKYNRCCGPTPHTSHMRCCDHSYGLIYDPRKTACCNGLLVSAERLVGRAISCCGIVPYDSGKYICCWDCIQRRRSGINSCCAKTAYNRSTHICCFQTGSVHPRPKFNSCCSGRIPYNTATHRCCHFARVIPRNKLC